MDRRVVGRGRVLWLPPLAFRRARQRLLKAGEEAGSDGWGSVGNSGDGWGSVGNGGDGWGSGVGGDWGSDSGGHWSVGNGGNSWGVVGGGNLGHSWGSSVGGDWGSSVGGDWGSGVGGHWSVGNGGDSWGVVGGGNLGHGWGSGVGGHWGGSVGGDWSSVVGSNPGDGWSSGVGGDGWGSGVGGNLGHSWGSGVSGHWGSGVGGDGWGSGVGGHWSVGNGGDSWGVVGGGNLGHGWSSGVGSDGWGSVGNGGDSWSVGDGGDSWGVVDGGDGWRIAGIISATDESADVDIDVEDGRARHLRPKRRSLPAATFGCPVCGVTLRQQELQQHWQLEVDRLQGIASNLVSGRSVSFYLVVERVFLSLSHIPYRDERAALLSLRFLLSGAFYWPLDFDQALLDAVNRSTASPRRDEDSVVPVEGPEVPEDKPASDGAEEAKSTEPDLPKGAMSQVVQSLRERLRKLESDNQAVSKCLICMGAKKLCPQCNSITSASDLRRIYL
ncbi:hypothetical protein MTO96_015710 [Rhipicephalus appendiculatus]